jgi:hypothetical protein
MITRNLLAGGAIRLLTGLLPLCVGLSACASGQPIQAAQTNFNGAWTVKLCAKANPKLQCGSFDLYLVQRGERICGTHFAATPGLGRLDEGDPASVLGASNGNAAVLLVNNSRANSKYLATIKLADSTLSWRVIGTVVPGKRPWDSIVPVQITLKRNEEDYAKEQWQELKDAPCRWPDEVPEG